MSRATIRTDDVNDEATADALFAVAGPAFNAQASSYFTAAEASDLRAVAQELWSNGHWLRILLQDHGDKMHRPDLDSAPHHVAQLDAALAAIITCSFRIGAAFVVHPASKRYLDSTKMEALREKRLRSPRNRKRERIKNTVLVSLLARGASREEQVDQLRAALSAEKAGTISQETADRWKKEVQLALAANSKI